MQTFLPYPNFRESAKCLDNKRLGKQRVEVYQILRVLTGQSQGWKNHPAVKMWRDQQYGLALYGIVCCNEWIQRGFKDTLREKLSELRAVEPNMIILPTWFGDEAFHASHRSNLLRKDPIWYNQFGWTESSDLPYVWPVK
jgi:hypothetical protein